MRNTGDLSDLFIQPGLCETGLWDTDFQVAKQLKCCVVEISLGFRERKSPWRTKETQDSVLEMVNGLQRSWSWLARSKNKYFFLPRVIVSLSLDFLKSRTKLTSGNYC